MLEQAFSAVVVGNIPQHKQLRDQPIRHTRESQREMRETGDCGERKGQLGSAARGARKPARWFRDGQTDLVVVQETLGDVLPLLETVNQFMVGPVSREEEGEVQSEVDDDCRKRGKERRGLT